MHQIRFRPHWGAYSAPPDPLAGFKGPTSKGREGKKGRGGKRMQGKGNGGPTYKGREKRGREGSPGYYGSPRI